MENFFGRNIKHLRKRRKITLIELASTLEISKSALSDYENGKSKPGLDVVIKLSEYFLIPVDDLNNSVISEFEKVDLKSTSSLLSKKKEESLEEITSWKQKNDFKLNLLQQKNETLEMRLQLIHELMQSKEAENKTLHIQVNLLQEKLKMLQGG